MTTIAGSQIVPSQSASLPALQVADAGVASSLESVISDNTRRVYGTQWRLFDQWCAEVGLASLPAEPLTVARYLAHRAGEGATIATLRLATSAISKAHEWAQLESPCRDPGVRASLKGWGRRLAKPQRQSGALTADVLAVIRLTAVQPRRRGRGIETAEQAAERAKFDLALVAVPVRRWVAPLRGGRVDLERRPTLGRRQRPHHRDPLQDRRRGPGRRGGYHPHRRAGALRHTARRCRRLAESVWIVGIADRPSGKSHRQGRWSG